MRFSASWDRTTQILSASVFALLVGIALLVQIPGIVFLAFLILLLGYAWSPRGYVVTDREITVKRLIGNVTIPLADIQAVRRATPDDLKGTLRMFGSGGLFGYYGSFRNSALGMSSWYVTNQKNVVVLIGSRTTLFSPDDVDGFLAEIRTIARVPETSSVPLNAMPAVSNRAAWIVGILFAAVVLGVVGFALAYSPGLPNYTLANGALTIHDRFYPVTLQGKDIDVAHISVVDTGTDGEWHPVARTNGFANLNYRSGWFRVANGQKVRLYAADSKRLVLLPPKGNASNAAPVLLQVKHPEEFVKEVRKALG